MSKRIAVLAEEGLVLDALLEAWADSAVLQAHPPLLLSLDDDGSTALYHNRPLAFHAFDQVDVTDIGGLLLLTNDEQCHDWLQSLTCPVIGSISVMRGFEAQPFGEQSNGKLFIPHAASLALRCLLGDTRCDRLSAVLLLPASGFGKAGVDELASQTVRLLNAQAAPTRVFDRQLSFNGFPFVGAAEMAPMLEREWQSLSAVCHAALIQMPVFHGVGMQLSLQLSENHQADQLVAWWQQSAQIVVEADAADCSIMAAAQLEGQLQLGNIRVYPDDPRRLDVWLAFDDIQLMVRQGLVSAAEFLLKHDL